MKGVLKKNQVMITALAIMIAIAGYLNFAGSKLENEALMSADNSAVTANADTDAVAAAEGLDVLAEINEYDMAGLEISDEDIEQAGLEINSLDSEADLAQADYLDEEMAEAVPEDITDGNIPGEAVFTSTTNVATLSGAKLMKEQTRAKNKETLMEIINSATLSEDQKQTAVNSMITLTDIAEKETAAEILLEAKGFDDVVVSISGETADVVVNAAELTDAQRAQIEDIIKRKTGITAENIIISPVIAN